MSKLIEASRYATQVHLGQKRKGKEEPYIMHPLTVGTLLAQKGADENTIMAGMLHDTIEDCVPYGSVTKEILVVKFNPDVSRMVNDVTEQDKSLPWAQRKQEALDHIQVMQPDSQMVKSADVLHNMTEQMLDYQTKGNQMFEIFNASKDQQIGRYEKLILALDRAWGGNPFLPDLKQVYGTIEQEWR